MDDSTLYAGPAASGKTCTGCGVRIKRLAEICPHCGVRQARRIDKTALVLLTFFLGGLGAHKFYLGKTLQGALYLLFCWTTIPGMIALVEFVLYLLASEEELNAKHGGSTAGWGTVVAIVLGAGAAGLVLLGIVAALVIPLFLDFTNKAKVTNAERTIKAIMKSEETRKDLTGSYSGDLDSIGFTAPEDGNFSYSVRTDGKQLEVRAKLLKPIGKADPGDEIVAGDDRKLSTVGDIGKYVKRDDLEKVSPAGSGSGSGHRFHHD